MTKNKLLVMRIVSLFICVSLLTILVSTPDERIKISAATVNFGTEVWHIETVDSGIDKLEDISLALDATGNPHISYHNLHADGILYAKWTGSEWHQELIEVEGGGGSDTSIQVDSQNNVHISYRCTFGELGYVKWTGTSWESEVVDEDVNVWDTALALDPDGNPHIAYLDGLEIIKYAKRSNGQWIVENVTAGELRSPSLALDSTGKPHIAYLNATTVEIEYAKWTGSYWQIEKVAPAGVSHIQTVPSLTLDPTGAPHISFGNTSDKTLRYAKRVGEQWVIETVDNLETTRSSIVLDSNGYPHISYHTSLGDEVKYARWSGSAWEIELVGSAPHAREVPMALDLADVPHICYGIDTNDDFFMDTLKYAKRTRILINQLPIVTITFPSPNEILRGTITIEGTASDPDGSVQKVEVKIDDTDWQVATGTTSWTFTWDTTKVADGEHIIYARCYDGTNYSATASVTVKVQQTPREEESPPKEKEEGKGFIPGFEVLFLLIGILLVIIIIWRNRSGDGT